MIDDDEKTLTILGTHGRDAGKTFAIGEIDPLALAGYVLRLVAALRVESYDALLEQLEGRGLDDVPINTIMQLLQGADPKAVHALITEVLQFVRVAPDPQHPGVRRVLMVSDIRELRTLGDVLMGLAKLNLGLGSD